VCRKLEVCKSLSGETKALYDRAARYRPLLECVADRILGDSEKAKATVEKCLRSAASESALDCESAFRGWLVRLVMNQAFAILHAQVFRNVGVRASRAG
jgi:DNA-directed RNA polymerase specialized sigma24 family protein